MTNQVIIHATSTLSDVIKVRMPVLLNNYNYNCNLIQKNRTQLYTTQLDRAQLGTAQCYTTQYDTP